MDTFNLIFVFLMVIGFIIIIYSLVKINKSPKDVPIFESDKSLVQVKQALSQVDIAIDDLNYMSEEVIKIFDQKKNELISFYNLAENKKYNTQNSRIDIKLGEEDNILKKNKAPVRNIKALNNPLLPKIKELLEQKLDIPEIAKILNIGSGEVELIIELGKEDIWKKNIYF